MNRFLKYYIVLCVFICGQSKVDFVNNSNETTTYAKALVGCNLYKDSNMNQNISNIYFQIPESYFVIVLDAIDDNRLKVQYDKYIGYVDASTVVIATFIPILKTLSNIKFDIKSTSGTQIWSSPSTKSNICTTIVAGTKNINYVAFAYGDIPSGGESNLWYYVTYTPDSNSTNYYEGYIYSENTVNLSEIVFNTETNPIVISEDKTLDEKTFLISSTLKTIVVAVIVIPFILFLSIILYKIIKKLKNNTFYNKNNNKIKDKNKLNKNSIFEKFGSMKLLKIKNKNNFDNDDELL